MTQKQGRLTDECDDETAKERGCLGFMEMYSLCHKLTMCMVDNLLENKTMISDGYPRVG